MWNILANSQSSNSNLVLKKRTIKMRVLLKKGKKIFK